MDIISYILSKKYTDKSLVGAGALKGANCTIQSIEPISGGHRITFKWVLNDDTVETDTMDVMDGDNGLGIKSVDINSKNHLIVTYDDNTTHDAGLIRGGSGGGSTVVVTPTLSSGTKIAEIEVDGDTQSIFAPSGGGASALSELSDIDFSTLSDGDVLVYDNTSGKWVNESPEDGALVTAVLSKDTMPTAGVEYEDIVILYIGTTSANYTKGHSYLCVENSGSYSWTDITPSGGSGSTVVVTPVLESGTKIAEIDVDGTTTNLFAPSGSGGNDSGVILCYFDKSAQKIYADPLRTIELTPNSNSIYISYSTPFPEYFVYQQNSFIDMPYSVLPQIGDIDVAVAGILNAPIRIFQFAGTNGYSGFTTGYFYKADPEVVTEEMWASVVNPRASGFKEYDSITQTYSLTTDRTRVAGKTYYYVKFTQLDAQPRGETVTQFRVTVSNWTTDTTTQSGSTLYKKTIPLTRVDSTNGVVSIGATGTLPTVAEQTAFDLIQYVTIDSAVPCLYLYASAIPTDLFYIKVEGVA